MIYKIYERLEINLYNSKMISNIEDDQYIVEKSNVPRKLNENELTEILNSIPNIKSSTFETSDGNKISLLKTLKQELKSIYLTPEAIEDLKEELQTQFIKARVKPGMVVGVTAAEAMGGPITQMALNSFHQSGSAKNVTYGVDRIKELINASANVKHPSALIYFKDINLTFDDIITKERPKFTEITVGNLLLSIPDIEEIETYEQIEMDEPWWYRNYRMLIRNDFAASHFLRLKINVNLLYSYKITMEEICNTIEREQLDSPLICVYSPISEGIIDIYPVIETISNALPEAGIIDIENAASLFLIQVVLPALSKLRIKGVRGIKRLYPVENTVWQIVREEQFDSNNNVWFLILDVMKMQISGISVERLVNLCQVAGITVEKVRPNYIAVKTTDNLSPSKIVNDAINDDLKDQKDYEAHQREIKADIIRRDPTPIYRASKIVHADTEGSAFKTTGENAVSTLRILLGRTDVDSMYTITNNVHEIKRALGIEAARSFLIQEIGNVIAYEGSYIDPRHIVLLVDYMTSLGDVFGVTFTGVSKQNVGPLSKASFQQVMDTFEKAAAFGAVDEMKSTSSAIFIGKTANIGTGLSDTFIQTDRFRELEESLNDPKSTLELDASAFNDALESIIDITEGIDLDMFDEIAADMFAGTAESDPSQLIDIFGPKDPSELIRIAGPIVHAKELDIIAENAGVAPCMKRRPERSVISIDSIKSPISTSGLTFAKPGVIKKGDKGKEEEDIIDEGRVEKKREEKKEYVAGPYGLPSDIFEAIQIESKSITSPLPGGIKVKPTLPVILPVALPKPVAKLPVTLPKPVAKLPVTLPKPVTKLPVAKLPVTLPKPVTKLPKLPSLQTPSLPTPPQKPPVSKLKLKFDPRSFLS